MSEKLTPNLDHLTPANLGFSNSEISMMKDYGYVFNGNQELLIAIRDKVTSEHYDPATVVFRNLISPTTAGEFRINSKTYPFRRQLGPGRIRITDANPKDNETPKDKTAFIFGGDIISSRNGTANYVRVSGHGAPIVDLEYSKQVGLSSDQQLASAVETRLACIRAHYLQSYPNTITELNELMSHSEPIINYAAIIEMMNVFRHLNPWFNRNGVGKSVAKSLDYLHSIGLSSNNLGAQQRKIADMLIEGLPTG